MCDEFRLGAFWGALDDDTADELEQVVEARRESRSDSRRVRIEEIVNELED